MKSAAALSQPQQLHSLCQFLCLAERSAASSQLPGICACSPVRSHLWGGIDSAHASYIPVWYKVLWQSLQPSAEPSVLAARSVGVAAAPAPLRERSSRGCLAKRAEAGRASASFLLGSGVGVFLGWRL